MHVYPIYIARFDETGDIVNGPSVGEVLAIRLTWRGMKRKFRKLDWKKEIIDHLIFIDDRDDFEAVNVKIEEIANNLNCSEDVLPAIEARVSYSIKDKNNDAIMDRECKEWIVIAPVLDAQI